MRAPIIPISYNTIKGTAIKSMVKRVASGVTMADRINAAMIACFRYFANTWAETTPTVCTGMRGMVELQIDNFATAQEGQDWLRTPAFAENPIGVEYDPDQLVSRFRAGVPVAELVARDPVPAA